MQKTKFLIAFFSLALVIFGARNALAANLGGQPVTTVEDVIAATGTNPVMKKDSLLYVTHDRLTGNVEFKYARFGDDYKLETNNKTLFTKTTSAKNYKISGLHPAVSVNYTNSTVPPAIVMIEHLFQNQPNYPVNLFQVSKDANNVIMSEKATVNVMRSLTYASANDVSELKGGIFAAGNNREIFAALQWVDESAYHSVTLDLFSVAQGGGDMKREESQNFAFLNASEGTGNIFARMAVGDFNGDGYANEIAVFTNTPPDTNTPPKNKTNTNQDLWKYYLYVFQVNWKGSAIEITDMIDAKEVYSHALGKYNTNRDIWFLKAAGDVVMADFNGDGRNEIAVVYKGYNEDLPSGLDGDLNNIMGPVYVKLYQYNASGSNRLVESKTTAKKSFSSVGNWNSDKRQLSDLGDLKAVAADVDGDGKSELAMLGIFWEATFEHNRFSRDTLTAGTWRPRLHLWRYSEPANNTPINDVPARLNMKYDKEIAQLEVFYSSESNFRTSYLNYDSDNKIGGLRTYVTGNTFTEPMFQMISGVFSGTATTQKPCDDIIIGHSRHMGRGVGYIKAFCPVLDNTGKFKEFKTVDIESISEVKENITVGLAAGDFVGDGVLLKNPYHFYYDGRSVFTSIIQALPYHVDYIPLPWETDGKPKLANFTYVPGGEVTYVRTDETKNKNTKSTTSGSTYEMKGNIGGSLSIGLPAVPGADVVKNFVPSYSFLLDTHANYKGKDLNTKLSTITETVKTTESVKASAVDSIMSYSVRHHTWRYPIEPVPAWYYNRSKDIDRNGQFAYTVTMSEAPKSIKSRTGYNARHEEGNLFSYPTKLDNIPDFTNAKTKLLSDPLTYVLEAGEYKKSLEFTKISEDEKTITADYNVNLGFEAQFMYGNYGIGKTGARISTNNDWGWEGSRKSVLSGTHTRGDKLEVTFADPSKASKLSGIIENVAFATTYQAYMNPDGLMKMAFAVNLQGAGSPVPMLWRDSIYNSKTDPSFVLPNKFVIKDSTVAINPDKLSATAIRGVQLYVLSGDKQTLLPFPYLVAGSNFSLDFPIYNASFVDTPAFNVRLSYAHYKDRNDTSKFTKIGETTITGLKGWAQNSEANKTYANFKWTIPNNITLGDYVFMAEIDPENKISEIHEEWSEEVPGGNNTATFIFPIMNSEGKNPSTQSGKVAKSEFKTKTQVGKTSNVKTSAVENSNSDYVPLVWEELDSATELYEYILTQNEPVEIRLNVDYIAKSEPGNTLFEITQEYTDEDGEKYDEIYDEESYYVIADDKVNYDFYFIVSSEDIKDKEAIYLDITDLDELTSDDEYYTISIPIILSPSDDEKKDNPNNPDNPENSDDNNNNNNNNNNYNEYRHSSGGGCEIGFSVLSLGLALTAIVLKRKNF